MATPGKGGGAAGAPTQRESRSGTKGDGGGSRAASAGSAGEGGSARGEQTRKRLDLLEEQMSGLRVASDDMRGDMRRLMDLFVEMRGAMSGAATAAAAAVDGADAGDDDVALAAAGAAETAAETSPVRTPAVTARAVSTSGLRSTRLATGGASTHLAPPGDTVSMGGRRGDAPRSPLRDMPDVPDTTGYILRAADAGARMNQDGVDRLARGEIKRVEADHLKDPVAARNALVALRIQLDGFVIYQRSYPSLHTLFAPQVLSDLRTLHPTVMRDVDDSPTLADRFRLCWELLVEAHEVRTANLQAAAALRWTLVPTEAAAKEMWRKMAADIKAIEMVGLPAGAPDLPELLLHVITSGSRILGMRLREELRRALDEDARLAPPAGCLETRLAIITSILSAWVTRCPTTRVPYTMTTTEYSAHFLAPAYMRGGGILGGSPSRRDDHGRRDDRGPPRAQVAAVAEYDHAMVPMHGYGYSDLPVAEAAEEEVAYAGVARTPCTTRHDQLAKDGVARCTDCGRSIYPLTDAQRARGVGGMAMAATRGGHAGSYDTRGSFMSNRGGATRGGWPGGGMRGGAFMARSGYGMRGGTRGTHRGGGGGRGGMVRPRPDALAAGASLLPRAPPYQGTVAAATLEPRGGAGAPARGGGAAWHAVHGDDTEYGHDDHAHDGGVAHGARDDDDGHAWGDDAYAAHDAGGHPGGAHADEGDYGDGDWYGYDPGAYGDGYVNAVLADGAVDAGAVPVTTPAMASEAPAAHDAVVSSDTDVVAVTAHEAVAHKPVRHVVIVLDTETAPCTTVLLDTGAERNLVNHQLVVAAELGGAVRPADVRLKTASGADYPVRGMVTVPFTMTVLAGDDVYTRSGALECCVVDDTPRGIGVVVSHHHVDDPTLASPFSWVRAVSREMAVSFPVPQHMAARTPDGVVAAVASLSLRGLMAEDTLEWPTADALAEARAADAAEPRTVLDDMDAMAVPRLSDDELRSLVRAMLNPDLPAGERDRLEAVLWSHRGMFQPMQAGERGPDLEAVITLRPGMEHATFNVGESKFSPALMPYVMAYLAEGVRAGVIEECEPVPQYCSRLLAIPKPTTPVSYRWCISLIQLNAIVPQMVAPALDMEPMLQAAAAAGMITTSDVSLGFGHVPLAAASRNYTAFQVAGRWFRHCTLPQGFINSTAVFTLWVTGILRHHIRQRQAVAFVDDMAVLSGREQHAAVLDAVLTTLEAHRVRLVARKTRVGYTRVPLLGRVVGEGRISPAPDRMQAVAAMAMPNNAARLRSFVSLIGWYRTELPDAHDLLAPLLPLLRDNTPVARLWGARESAAVTEIKRRILALPDRLVMDVRRPFTITTDASRNGVAAVLWQQQAGGDLGMVYCVSRSLSPAQRSWPVGDVEMLAVMLAVERFSAFIRFAPGTILYTDHRDLQDLLTTATVPASPRMQRWRVALAQFPLRIVHLPGIANSVADTFSREVAADTVPYTGEHTVAAVTTRRQRVLTPDGGVKKEEGMDTGGGGGTTTIDTPVKPTRHAEPPADMPTPTKGGADTRNTHSTRTDVYGHDGGTRDTRDMRASTGTHDGDTRPATTPLREAIRLAQQHIQSATRAQMARSTRFSLVRDADGVEMIFYDGALWVPPAAQDVQQRLLELAHNDNSHAGGERTLAYLRDARVVWHGMAMAVRRHLAVCLACARERAPTAPRPSAPVLTTPPYHLYEALCVDFAGPLPATPDGYVYVLVALDAASRWLTLIPTRDTTAATVIDALTRGVLAQPRPPFAVLVSDGASSFANSAVAAWLDVVGAAHLITTAYHSAANGLVERHVGTVLSALRKLPGDKKEAWHDELPRLAWALNTSANATTGVSPYTMLTGAAPLSGAAFALSQRGSPFTDYRHTFDQLHAFLEARYATLLPHVLRVRQRQHAAANAGRVMPDHPVGSTVLVHLPAGDGKLGTPYRSVYKVLAAPNAVIREVVPVDGSKERAFAVHVDRLVKYTPDPARHDIHQVAHQQLGQEFWLVDALETVRRRGRRVEVLVRWKGDYPATWEPVSAVRHLKLFPAFARAHPLARD